MLLTSLHNGTWIRLRWKAYELNLFVNGDLFHYGRKRKDKLESRGTGKVQRKPV